MQETLQSIKLSDYKKPNYHIESVHLTIDLDLKNTKIISKMQLKQQSEENSLYLHGEELELVSVKLDGETVDQANYNVTKEGMTLKNLPKSGTLEIENFINPEANTALEGIYRSGNIYCTQCEAEGFRKITYFLDRPDNMSMFTTKVIGDQKTEPYLLSNGNPVAKGNLENGRHWVEWEDPFPKPSYLFALVAGDLGLVKDTFTTSSGREVALEIYVDHGNESKCDHAMQSLKNSMKWDEERYGLEYDLDIYMIVAVDSFNMGAMENKGLNIFNSAYVLADKETATDQSFLGVESVIGHEYFHNWTGNRVTCRDWFQLTLKEGLTVYRDQEFSSDLNSRSVKRIDDVSVLKSHQFTEDAGPNAHPIKPKEYAEINNFYTATIYEKGAEVIRMIETLVGREGFRKGMDEYFRLFDGQAVTTEDFVHAMSVANDIDLTHFSKWYDYPGTPNVSAHFEQDLDAKKVFLTLKQSSPSNESVKDWEEHLIPLKFALVSEAGEQTFTSSNLSASELEKGLIIFNSPERTIIFEDVTAPVLPSLNRDFSAPVNVSTNLTEEENIKLLKWETNAFNAFELAQTLFNKSIVSMVEGKTTEVSQDVVDAVVGIFNDSKMDDATKAMTIRLPEMNVLFQLFKTVDVQKIHEARKNLKKSLALGLKSACLDWLKNYQIPTDYDVSPSQVGGRDLFRVVYSYLAELDDSEVYLKDAAKVYGQATNMTDRFNMLALLSHYPSSEQKEVLLDFYDRYKDQTLVVQKWIGAQASSSSDDVLEKLRELEELPEFDIKVPNLVRSLVGTFAMRNPAQFHRADGLGYEYVMDKIIELDSLNPQIASRIVSAFNLYSKLVPSLQEKMKVQLDKLMSKKDISKNVEEIASKILASV